MDKPENDCIAQCHCKDDQGQREDQTRPDPQLANALEHYRAIVQNSDDAIVSKTLTGVVTSWNPAAQAIFGYAEHEILGKNIAILIPVERLHEEEFFLQKMVDGEKIDHFETERIRKDGSRILVSETLSPIRSPLGEVVGVSKISRDITKSVKLHAADQIASAIIQSSDDAIVSKTLKGVITGWNRGATLLFGYSEEEMLGTTLERLLPDDRRNEELFILERISNGEKIDHFETERVRKDGTTVMVSVSISPIFDSWGRIIGAAKIARDITERKRAEELMHTLNQRLEENVAHRTKQLTSANAALQQLNIELKLTQAELVRRDKLAALGALVAGVSHEMGTPLGNCLTVGSSLQHELTKFETDVDGAKVSKARLREFNQTLHDGLQLLLKNLNRAIEQIVHFKQISIHQASEQRKIFALKSVIDNMLVVHKPEFARTGHRISTDVPDDLTMDSFPGAIGEIVANLLRNSVLHAFENGMQGEISIVASMESPDVVNICYTDNGKGIAQEIIDRIFDPFFTTRMGQSGGGLGLNVVYNLVTVTLAGTIHVTSEVGRFTSFSISMPAKTPSCGSKAAGSG